MAYVYFGNTIKELRLRKEWNQKKFLEELDAYSPSVYRLEYGELIPEDKNKRKVLDVLDAPMEELVCPHLDSQPMKVYQLRYRLHQALDDNDLLEAERVFNEVSALMNQEGPVNRQYVLSQKTRILELRGKNPSHILPLVIGGIKETYREFNENSPGTDVLLFEEADLFHTLARLYARLGRHGDSIRILRETFIGLQKLPISERERDRRALPLLMSLVGQLMLSGEYQEAVKYCEFGIKISAMRCFGNGMSDFLHLKADAMLKLAPDAKVDSLLRMAYAGYLLLGEKEKADKMLSDIRGAFGIAVNTYGMENAVMPLVKKVPYAMGLPPACKTIGEMLQKMRTDAGISLKELSQGICSLQNLSKIENGEIKGNMYYFEPILQRLGRQPSLYCNFFLLRKDFEAVGLRDMIHLLLIHRKYEEAAKALEKLKTYKSFQSKANLQFVLDVEITLQHRLYGNLNPLEHEKKLLETLRLSCPEFDETRIRNYALTHVESILINKLANLYMRSKDYDRAANIFESLIANLDRRYVDEYEKARMYAAVMYNYSTCLGRAGRRREALEVVEKALLFEQSKGSLSMLPVLVFNKAYNICMMGDETESLPYFALSYYGSCLFEDYGEAGSMEITRKFVFEKFGLSLVP